MFNNESIITAHDSNREAKRAALSAVLICTEHLDINHLFRTDPSDDSKLSPVLCWLSDKKQFFQRSVWTHKDNNVNHELMDGRRSCLKTSFQIK